MPYRPNGGFFRSLIGCVADFSPKGMSLSKFSSVELNLKRLDRPRDSLFSRIFLSRLSKPYARATAVLVDELDGPSTTPLCRASTTVNGAIILAMQRLHDEDLTGVFPMP
jgi:hypothetical protein